MNNKHWQPAFITVILFAFLQNALTHPISLTSARALVYEDKIDLAIDIMAEDYMLYYGLVPDTNNRIPADKLQQSLEEHRYFLLGGLKIFDSAGNTIKGTVKGIEGSIPENGIETERLMDVLFTYHLTYPLEKRPDFLTFSQSFGSGYVMLPSVMELMVVQEGFEPDPPVILSSGENPATFEFFWDGNKPGQSTGLQAWAEKKQRLQEKRMGISSYTAIYSFIYITDHEVRLELLIPLATLETWVPMERNDRAFLEIEEQESAYPVLETFFQNINRVRIDGIEVKPTVQRLDFYGLSFRDFAVRPEKKRLSAPTARIGIILSYSTFGPPARVNIKWELFNAYVYNAKAVVIAHDTTTVHQFNIYKPLLEWLNPGTPEKKQVQAVSAGTGNNLTADERKSITTALLKNVYRAFDWHKESDIYDALAQSIRGDLLAEVYLNIRKSLILREQGGAISTVKNVEVLDATITASDAVSFRANMNWTVEGTVEHWGHIHTRINQFAAEFIVQESDSEWKIVHMAVREQKRLKYFLNLRTF